MFNFNRESEIIAYRFLTFNHRQTLDILQNVDSFKKKSGRDIWRKFIGTNTYDLAAKM